MRLEKLPAEMAKRLSELECPDFKTTPWVEGKPLAERRVAIVSSAGLVVRGDRVFRGRDPDYRAIPGTTQANDLCAATSRSISTATGSRKIGTWSSRSTG